MARTPFGLVSSGYILTANSLAVTCLGFSFWFVAAGRFAAGDVGLATALISAIMVTSGIGCVGLPSALSRFIPTTGAWTTMVVRGYALALAVTATLALGVGILLGAVSDLDRLSSPEWLMLFVFSGGIWSVFTLQDFVLIARRRPALVAIENLAVALARLGLLFVPGMHRGPGGLLIAWLVPTVAAVVVINVMVLRPMRLALSSPQAPGFRRFAAISAIGTSANVLTLSAMPAIVASSEGVRSNARFFLPWAMASGLQAIASSMAAPLLPALAGGYERDAAATRRVLAHTCGATLLVALPAALVAPRALQLLGGDYRVDLALTSLLLGSSVMASGTIVLIARAKAHNRVVQVAVVQWAIAAVLLTGSFVLLPGLHLIGVGWAALAAQATGLVLAAQRQRVGVVLRLR